MSLLQKLINNFKDHQIDLNKTRFLLAVSGGKDSMVLIHLLRESGAKFEVAHMNYQLRESDSEKDFSLVKEVCESFKIPFHSQKVDTKTFCEENKVSTQEGARILRYSWFEELLISRKLDLITTAHHASDNVETFLQNLKRGSGFRGLKSMVFLQQDRCKPMLNFSREEIDGYQETNKIPYRQDASNNQNHYQRNAIRNEFLPEAEKLLPGFKAGIVKSLNHIQSDYDYLFMALQKESEKVLAVKGKDALIDNFRSIHPRLLFHILEQYGFNYNQVQDILNAQQAGKSILNESFEALVFQEQLIIHPVTSSIPVSHFISDLGTFTCDEFELQLGDAIPPESFSKETAICWVDKDLLSFPLELRTWEAGDKFRPLGMKGSKKISDFLNDLKIPLHIKSNVKVLISSEKIVWVVNYGVSDLFKITNSTKNIVKIETKLISTT